MSDMQPLRVLCKGTRFRDKKKLTCIVLVDDENNEIGEGAYFGKLSGMYPGNVYEVSGSASGEEISTIKPSTVKFIEILQDKDRSAAIRLISEAEETTASAYNQAKKTHTDKSDILETLKPLREAWMSSNTVGRLALEVRILHYLRRGGDL